MQRTGSLARSNASAESNNAPPLGSPGALEPWSPGALERWSPGALVPWSPGVRGPRALSSRCRVEGATGRMLERLLARVLAHSSNSDLAEFQNAFF
jgi:hypothetical protein